MTCIGRYGKVRGRRGAMKGKKDEYRREVAGALLVWAGVAVLSVVTSYWWGLADG